MKKQDADARRHFLKAGIAAAGTALWSGTFFQSIAAAAGQNLPPAEAGAIGRRELLEGLDGMSRVAFLLRFTLSHPGLDTTIVGTSSVEHLRDNLAAAAQGPLPAELVDDVKRRLSAAGARPTPD